MNVVVVLEEGSIISESSLQIAIGYSPDSTKYVTEVWKLRERVPTLRREFICINNRMRVRERDKGRISRRIANVIRDSGG